MDTVRPLLDALSAGLPVLLPQFVAALGLLVVGVGIYMGITPFNERRLVAEGNAAGGISMGGAILALAIPLSATLATNHAVIDIVLWGIVALALQLITFAIVAVFIHGLRRQIESGNVASAAALVGIQLAVALMNAAAMAG